MQLIHLLFHNGYVVLIAFLTATCIFFMVKAKEDVYCEMLSRRRQRTVEPKYGYVWVWAVIVFVALLFVGGWVW